MDTHENYNKEISDFLIKFMKLKNLGVDEFIRQEIIFKNNTIGLELDNLNKILFDVIFEKDEIKKNQKILDVLSKTNQIVINLNDIDNKSKALEIKYKCLYELKRYEEALVAIFQAIKTYPIELNQYAESIVYCYEKAMDLLRYFKLYDEVIFICNQAEILCKNDEYLTEMNLEIFISRRAEAFFDQGKQEQAFTEIDKAIYLFPNGDINQYSTYRSLYIRANFKKELGDEKGGQIDKEMSNEWERKFLGFIN